MTFIARKATGQQDMQESIFTMGVTAEANKK